MYCRHCDVTVDCEAKVCPLCKEELEEDGKQVKDSLPSPKGSVKKQRLDHFSKVYIPAAILIMLICVLINVFTKPSFMWSVMVIVSLVYVYYCIRFTFIAQGNFNMRILGQAVVLTIIFIIVRITAGGNHWVFITWLPIVYFLSEVMICIYQLTTIKTNKSQLGSLFVLTVLGIIPICAAYILDLSVKWPSIAASSFSLLVMAILIIVARKQIFAQIKRYFHI